jgi:hypothetical protein
MFLFLFLPLLVLLGMILIVAPALLPLAIVAGIVWALYHRHNRPHHTASG